jgi:4-carboxymuconolactone decarboxylase
MSEQYRRGIQEIMLIDPEHGEESIEELQRICPDFAEYFVTIVFGEFYSRKILDPKTKALIGIGNLIGIGHCHGFLRTQILGASRAGCARQEIAEAIIQSAVHSGFPAALSALKIMVEAFADEATSSSDIKGARRQKGKKSGRNSSV